MSLREMTLILAFHSVYSSGSAANCWICFSEKSEKYFSRISIAGKAKVYVIENF